MLRTFRVWPWPRPATQVSQRTARSVSSKAGAVPKVVSYPNVYIFLKTFDLYGPRPLKSTGDMDIS